MLVHTQYQRVFDVNTLKCLGFKVKHKRKKQSDGSEVKLRILDQLDTSAVDTSYEIFITKQLLESKVNKNKEEYDLYALRRHAISLDVFL